MTRKALVSLAVAAAALLAPQAASAADLYVAPGADGEAECTYDSQCTLWSAIQRADHIAGRDTIHVTGTISETQTADLAQSPIDLVGTVGAQIDFAARTWLIVGPDSSVSRLHVTGQRQAVVLAHGAQLSDARVEALVHGEVATTAVTVLNPGTTARPAVIARVDIEAAEGTGVYVNAVGDRQRVQIVDSNINARQGVEDTGAPGCVGFSLQSSTVVATVDAVVSRCDDEIVNSVIRQTNPGRDGVSAEHASLTISHSTIVGGGSLPPDIPVAGIGVRAWRGGHAALTESIVSQFDYALGTLSAGSIDATRSSTGESYGDLRVNDPAPAGSPQFLDAAAGDYRLGPDSPLVDAGYEPQAGPAQTDRAGADRFADGNGDGKAEGDIGAYERPAVERPTPPADQNRPADPQPQGDEMRPHDTPVGPTPPRLTFAGTTLTVTRQRQVTLPVTCNSSAGGCKLAVEVTARVGKRSITLAHAGAARFKLSRRAVALIARSRIRRVTVALTATDPAGSASATRGYRLLIR
ncbi:MAG: hypothetical protein QOJ12_2786 [Thermoleophilales bacterium]|nr:hypothetical protein [Thermoleophilales bacterium]